METFGLESRVQGGFTVLAVRGEVDLSTAPQLREALTSLIAEGHLAVVVDLSAVEFVDSTGLGALVTALKRLRARGGEMRVVCTSPRVCKVFEITSLDRVLPMYDSVEKACAPA